MKFRKLIPVILSGVLLIAYFTKPTKDDFLKYIQPMVQASGATPVVSYEDKLLYAKLSVFLVNPINQKNTRSATGSREEYVGAFKKFWKLNSTGN